MPAKGWKYPCEEWYGNDVLLLTAETSAEIKCLTMDTITRCMMNLEKPGTSVTTLSVLASRCALKTEGAIMTVLTEMAIRLRDVQDRTYGNLEGRYLFGFMWVDVQMENGSWIRVGTDTAKKVIEANLPMWSMVNISCPRVAQLSEKRAIKTQQRNTQRGVGDMIPMSPENGQSCNKVVEKRDKSGDMIPMSPATLIPSIPSINPLPPTRGVQVGELHGISGTEKVEGRGALLAGARMAARSGKSREGKEQKKRTAAVTTPEMDRVGSWFGHAPGTGWTVEDAEAWMQARKAIVNPEDFEALEWYYTTAKDRHGARRYARMEADKFWLCRHKRTLINKWQRQVEMAMERRENDRGDDGDRAPEMRA